MNLMQNSYRDNRDIELHYCDIRIFIIAQPYPGLKKISHYARAVIAKYLEKSYVILNGLPALPRFYTD